MGAIRFTTATYYEGGGIFNEEPLQSEFFKKILDICAFLKNTYQGKRQTR
jgi:hypothetical protein